MYDQLLKLKTFLSQRTYVYPSLFNTYLFLKIPIGHIHKNMLNKSWDTRNIMSRSRLTCIIRNRNTLMMQWIQIVRYESNKWKNLSLDKHLNLSNWWCFRCIIVYLRVEKIRSVMKVKHWWRYDYNKKIKCAFVLLLYM